MLASSGDFRPAGRLLAAQVGAVWAERSAGQAVFAMLYKLSQGLGLAQQIDAALR